MEFEQVYRTYFRLVYHYAWQLEDPGTLASGKEQRRGMGRRSDPRTPLRE